MNNIALSLLPMIANDYYVEGQVIHSHSECISKYNKSPCDRFYSELKDKEEGYYVCPSGYTVYNKIVNGEHLFYVGMMVKKHYGKLNAKNNATDNVSVVTEKMFEDIVKAQDELLHIQRESMQSKELNKDLLHDVKKLDFLIKTKAEGIIRDYEKKGDSVREIIQKVKNIHAMEELIACKYSVYDLASNIGMLSLGSTTAVNVYKIFDKARYVLVGYKNKSISIDFNGYTSYQYNMNLQYSHILPFLLMENAVKYTVKDHNVDVLFEEHNGNLFVTIKSFGPFCEDDEIKNVFNKGFRGRNTEKYTSEGSGVGLFLTKQICDYCDIDIRISSDYVKDINGIRCGFFKVELVF